MITKSSRHEATAAESIETTRVSSYSQQVLAPEDTDGVTDGVAGFGFLRENNDELTVRKAVRILRDPQVYEECEDWSLHMTDEDKMKRERL